MNLNKKYGLAKLRMVFFLFLMSAVAAALSAGGKQEPSQTDYSGIVSAGYNNPLIIEENMDSITFFDYDGNEVKLHKNPSRIIVHYTSMLGLWYMAGGEVIGRPNTRSGRGIPEAALHIETTGHVASPNTEKIVSLQPDLVILSGSQANHRNLKDILDQNGIENVLLSYEHFHDFVNTLDLFARLVGNDDIIEKSVPKIEKSVQDVLAKYTGRDDFSFLSLFASTRDVSAELNIAHTAHMASMLGGINVAEEGAPRRGQKRITLSMEHIVDRNPDLIFVTVMGDLGEIQNKMKEDMMSNQAWAGLPAVQNDRVYFLPGDLFLYKPNERFPEAFEYLGDIIFNN
jgi:iron complex transport system substrate-binding protein